MDLHDSQEYTGNSAPLARKAKAIVNPSVHEVIYYLTIDRRGAAIKIGKTLGELWRRVEQLQTAHPESLVVLAWEQWVAGKEEEIHKRFAAHRIRGEWFKRHPDLMEHIRQLKKAARRRAHGPLRRPPR